MSSQLSRVDVLRIVNEPFPDSLVSNQVWQLDSGTPDELLGRYVAALVTDLYGDRSDDAANLARIAQGLEFGTAKLEHLVRRLRQYRS